MDQNPTNPATDSPPAFDPTNLDDQKLRALLGALDASGGEPVNPEEHLPSEPKVTPAAAPAPAGEAGKEPTTPPAAEPKKVDSPATPPVAATETNTPANPTPEDVAVEKDLLSKLPPEIKPGTPEAKTWLDLRKGEHRQAETWKKINAAREEAAKLKAEAEAKAAELARQQEETANRFDAQDYLDAAASYRAGGKEAEAKLCEAEAAKLKAGKVDALRARLEQTRNEQTSRQRGWELAAHQAAQELPELTQADSPAVREAQKVFAENPALQAVPAGPLLAARMVKARLAAQAAQAELTQLKAQRDADQAEIRRLNGLMTPSPGHARGPRASDSDPAARSAAELRALCELADASR